MTPQETFDKVTKHLLTQGRPARNATTGSCYYKQPETGLKCAIGCLIPDDIYAPKMEQRGVGSLLREFPEVANLLPSDRSLLAGLQGIHDDVENITSDNTFDIGKVKVELYRLARDHHLSSEAIPT